MALFPWQKWWLIHALELEEEGGFRFRTILTLVGRQNGKTTLLKALAVYFMYAGLANMVLGVAQTLDIAKESWQGAIDLAKSHPELSAEIAKIRYANGEQEIRLVNGARYRVAAASRQSGRGLSVDLLVLDELREHRKWDAWAALSKTTIARPNGLIVAITNAGDDQSIVLNHQRASALSGENDTLAIFEWSAPDGCDLDDPNMWAMANPSLNHGGVLTTKSIRSQLATDPPATFRTEVLCQRVEALGDVAIPQNVWDACHDPEMRMDAVRDRLYACVDVEPQLAHCTLAVAGLGDDGRVRVGIVKAWKGPDATEQMRADLPALVARIRPKRVFWFPGGPAAALTTDMEALKAVPLNATDAATVCQGFAELALSRRLVHGGDPLLTNHVLGAKRYPTGDGWRFVRRGVGHVDAAYAAAGAAQAARRKPTSARVRWL